MNEKLFASKLEELNEKYSITNPVSVSFEDGAILTETEDGRRYRFYYTFSDLGACEEEGQIPLLHWRVKRRYTELKNLLTQGMVKKPLASRIHHMVSPDDFTHSLADIIFMECDLIEWITDNRIDSAFASMKDQYMNGILSTDGNVKVSMELGLLPEGSEPVLLHEIIAKTGILSDTVVDTQIEQYPVYVYRGKETVIYTDIDYELYGLTQTECDAIRFILNFLSNPEMKTELQEKARHLSQVIAACMKAQKEMACIHLREE